MKTSQISIKQGPNNFLLRAADGDTRMADKFHNEATSTLPNTRSTLPDTRSTLQKKCCIIC